MTLFDTITSIQPASHASPSLTESVKPSKLRQKGATQATSSLTKTPETKPTKPKRTQSKKILRDVWLTREYCIKVFKLEPADVPREKVLDYFERHKMKWEFVDKNSVQYLDWQKCWYGRYGDKESK